jgi:hypothetical protein
MANQIAALSAGATGCTVHGNKDGTLSAQRMSEGKNNLLQQIRLPKTCHKLLRHVAASTIGTVQVEKVGAAGKGQALVPWPGAAGVPPGGGDNRSALDRPAADPVRLLRRHSKMHCCLTLSLSAQATATRILYLVTFASWAAPLRRRHPTVGRLCPTG